ncbi:MAG: hypothetical protein ACLQVI_02315 [Polyangiaceae bacterium]
MTRKVARMTHRSRMPACLVGACAVIAVVACGPKPPPPHIVEVPIDQFDTGPRAAATVAVEPTQVAVVTEPGAPRTRPTALTTGPAAPSGPPAGQRLTAAECDKMLDKGAIQYGISKQVPVAKAMRMIPQLRTQAQADPTFAEVTSSCVKQNTKTQYTCAMRSPSFDKWKACFEPAP